MILRNGIYMPSAFMSANFMSEKQMVKMFIAGLESGVRGFDTAREYKAEKAVGNSLRKALDVVGLKREHIFIQSRISNSEISHLNIYDEVNRSLDKLGLDYIDSFMFHWPTPGFYIDAWKQLEEIFASTSIIRSIGICNCRLRHLRQMELSNIDTLPHILQVEVTPFWQIKDLKAFCNSKEIALQAFSPLCKMIDPLKENSVLKEISQKYEKSIPQVILKWNIQRGIAPISRTSKPERVKSNYELDCFCLSEEDMNKIASLDCGYKYHLESSTCIGF